MATITITEEQRTFLIEAAQEKYSRLVAALTDCSQFFLNAQRVQAIKEGGMWEDPIKRAQAIKGYINLDREAEGKPALQPKELKPVVQNKKPVKKARAPKKTAEAPYGLKKDGTPAKKRGRPVRAK